MARTLILLLVLSTPAFAEGYSFVLDGEPIEPKIVSLAGTPGSPAERDLICVAGHWMVLGPPGRHRFERGGGGLLLRRDEEPAFTVFLADHRKLPLLAPEEIRRLLGLRFMTGRSLRPVVLSRLDGARVCVTMDASGRPMLPKGLRYLRLGYWSMRNVDSRMWLNGFNELRVLMISAWSNLPPSKLPRAPELRVLSAPRMEAGDYGMLRSYPKLRELSLTRAEGLTSIDFISFMPHLARLDLSRTRVTSLEPLKGHGAIREIDASRTMVAALPPGKLPALRRLDVHRARSRLPDPVSPIADRVVAEFRKGNPECEIRWRWGIAPAEAFAGVDRLVLLNGGSFRPKDERGKLRFQCSDPGEIRALFAGLAIRDDMSGGVCYCQGDHLMELYRGEKLLARVSIQHGFALRWLDGEWDGDARLTAESCEHLWQWLARHGVDELLKQAEATSK